MEEQKLPFETNASGEPAGAQAEDSGFPTGKRELAFGTAVLVLAVLLADAMLFGGLNLGFGVLAVGLILCGTVYLLRGGHRLTGYSGALLFFSLVIALSFLRSGDGFVKFVMFLFLLGTASLGLCLLAGQNRRDPGGVSSLLDGPRVLFTLGIGQMGASFRGLNRLRKDSSDAGKGYAPVLVGLGVSLPILAVMIPLLIGSDAAFEGLMDLLPQVDPVELYLSLFVGLPVGYLLYTAGTALHHGAGAQIPKKSPKLWNPLTVNTVLCAVSLLYGVYLLSQLAYFFGGFSGILPKGYTLAQYARRGFFEMAWLCAINLLLISGSAALSGGKTGIRSGTRWLCLFLGAVTLLLVATASAKMLMYIGGYGLTRLRVLTEVIMIFLGITTVLVCVWLFLPKFAYMKAVLLTALLLGSLTAWADVDTVVAAYNVEAYRCGQLQSVDVAHLSELSEGAVPYLALLAEDSNPEIAQMARDVLNHSFYEPLDLRNWNLAGALARSAWNFAGMPDDVHAEFHRP